MGVHVSRVRSLTLDNLGTAELLVRRSTFKMLPTLGFKIFGLNLNWATTPCVMDSNNKQNIIHCKIDCKSNWKWWI